MLRKGRASRRRGRGPSGRCAVSEICAEICARWTSVMSIVLMMLTGLLLRTIYLFFDPFQIFHWVPQTVLQTTRHVSTSLFFTAGLLLTKCFVTSVQFALHFRKNIRGARCLDWGVYIGCVILILYSLTSVVMNSPGLETPARYWDSYETMADACISVVLCGLFVYWGSKAVHLLSETLPEEKNSGEKNSGGTGASGSKSNWAKLRQGAKMISSKSRINQRRGLVQNWIRHIFRAAMFIFLNFLIIAFYSVGKQGNDPVSLFILNILIRMSVVFAVYSMFRIAEGSEVSKVSLGRILQMCCGTCCIRCCTSCCIVKVFGGNADYGRSHRLAASQRSEVPSKVSSRPTPGEQGKVGTKSGITASASGSSIALVVMDDKKAPVEKFANRTPVTLAQQVGQDEQGGEEGKGTWSPVKPNTKNDMYCENSEGFIDPETGQRYWLTADGRTSWTNPRHTLINTVNPLTD